jgi:hypothetical protein
LKKYYYITISLSLLFFITRKESPEVSISYDTNESYKQNTLNPKLYTFKNKKQNKILKLENTDNDIEDHSEVYSVGHRTKTLEIYHHLKDLPDSINLMDEYSHNPLKDISKSYQVNIPHVTNPSFGISLKVNKTLLQGKNPIIQLKTKFNYKGEDIFPAYTIIVKNHKDMNTPLLIKKGIKKSKLSFKLNSMLEAGDYIIQIEATPNGLNSQYPLMASSSFKVSPRFTQFQNESKDEVDSKGNLHYKALYKVMTKGYYNFEAVLNSQDGTPIALIENIVKLEEGVNWVDLPIHGYLFHKLNYAGSFIVTHQRLRKVKPNLSLWSNKIEVLDYETRSYSLSEFNSSPYENKVLLDKIKRLSQAN